MNGAIKILLAIFLLCAGGAIALLVAVLGDRGGREDEEDDR